MFDVLIVGCGLAGMVIARELADNDYKVCIVEKRNHIAGNIYDFKTQDGILAQKYGPHVFFTDDKKIEEYVTKYIPVDYIFAECRTYIDNQAIPMPFNFESIDIIYDEEKAGILKEKLIAVYGEDAIISVVDLINNEDPLIKEYGNYMYEKEYKKYTSKQWNRPIETIEPTVFNRVPVYISYKKPYLRKEYQFMPRGGFTKFAEKLLDHENIELILETDALKMMSIDNGKIIYDNFSGPIVYTGPIDELFDYKYGNLPYRSLEFTWKVIDKEIAPKTALSAYPEGDKYIRITDYTKFPFQEYGNKALIAIEYPFEYKKNELCGNEPYYPTLTKESIEQYNKYCDLANNISNLYVCGRLAEYKYMNMDEVIIKALNMSKDLLRIL